MRTKMKIKANPAETIRNARQFLNLRKFLQTLWLGFKSTALPHSKLISLTPVGLVLFDAAKKITQGGRGDQLESVSTLTRYWEED